MGAAEKGGGENTAMSELSPRAQAYVTEGLPIPGTPENKALIIATALDQLRAEAIDAQLDTLETLLRKAYEQAERDANND